jgi:hypothetical protein
VLEAASLHAQDEKQSFGKLVVQRVQLAEAGRWDLLLQLLVADLRAAESADQAIALKDAGRLPEQPPDDADVFIRVGRKMGSNEVRSAKAILLNEVEVLRNEDTAQRVDSLVCVSISDDERNSVQALCSAIIGAPAKWPRCSNKLTRARIRALRMGAQCGPSSWRNALIKQFAIVPGGVDALTKLFYVWVAVKLQPDTVRLWTAACVSLVDCGSQQGTQPGEPQMRKLRPIACAECLVKLVESIEI